MKALLIRDVNLKGRRSYSCSLFEYHLGHSGLIVAASPRGNFNSKKTLYFFFRAVRYIEAPVHWQGADFTIAPESELVQLWQALFGYDPERDSQLLEFYALFTTTAPKRPIRIIASKYATVGPIRPRYYDPPVEPRTSPFGLPETRRLTVAEFFAAYGDRPAEVVDGQILFLYNNPREVHRVADGLYMSLLGYAKQHQLGKVTIETSFVLAADPQTDWAFNIRQPDVAFVPQERATLHDVKHGKDGPWRLAPDLAIDVVATLDNHEDVVKRTADYLRYGTRLAWVLSPRLRTIRVHTPDNPDGSVLREGDILSADPVLPGWSMPLSAVFGEA